MSVADFHPEIRAAIRARLILLGALPAVAWEGRPFSPTRGTPYVSESVRSISSRQRALGEGGTIAHTITANYRLNYPSGSGTAAIEEMAGALMEHFRPGTSLLYAASSAVVQQAERTGLSHEPDWMSTNVIITLIGYTSN